MKFRVRGCLFYYCAYTISTKTTFSLSRDTYRKRCRVYFHIMHN